MACFGSPPAARNRPQQHLGIGLCDSKRVLTADSGKSVLQLQCIEQTHRQPLEFVGANCEAPTLRGESIERLFQSGEWPRPVGNVFGVEDKIVLIKPI